jgi:hypothetical protein
VLFLPLEHLKGSLSPLGRLLAFLANIRPGWKGMPVTNTSLLASRYLKIASEVFGHVEKKNFILLTPVANFINIL